MLSKHVFRPKAFAASRSISCLPRTSIRCLQYDGRNRLSNFWAPTKRAISDDEQSESGHDLLMRAGYLRQAHSGIFHLLPLGLRVQDKIERLIDKHMQSIGASKVSLSSLSSEELWQRSGRLDKGRTSELLRLEDRKGTKYLLSPTHEEEITTIIANAVHSYKELPLRLYQVSRKYRDEPRPRQGLLRGREFLMKDLYTFDADVEQAYKTYNEVRKAYHAFLEEFRLPYLTARADSGNMGGTLSHEFHFASPQGEDTIISCDTCDYSINEELYVGVYDPSLSPRSGIEEASKEVAIEHYVSKDRKNVRTIYYPANEGEPNIYAIKAIFPDVEPGLQGDQALKEQNSSAEGQTLTFRDPRLSSLKSNTVPEVRKEVHAALTPKNENGKPITLTKAHAGDTCPNCAAGRLTLQQAVEIGHTFHLGQRYSAPLAANILAADNTSAPIEMGCHGIGVSRLIGAFASLLADEKGLNWPLVVAPFEVVIVPSVSVTGEEVEGLYDGLTVGDRGTKRGVDVVVDDRARLPMGWRLKDADLVGYPFIVVMGKRWAKERMVELQCRRLGVKENVSVERGVDVLVGRVRELSERL